MHIEHATDQAQWDTFLSVQQFRPFLQSWTMGEVYRDVGQDPIRLIATDNNTVRGICQATIVPARRGKHLAIQYGPTLAESNALPHIINALKDEAAKHQCRFIRLSPFWPIRHTHRVQATTAPLHLLAEHLWYIPLTTRDQWEITGHGDTTQRTQEDIQIDMRKNHRNLIRRAGREGVEIVRSETPLDDLEAFITLHEETRKRHKFTPYTNAFFAAQVKHFSARNECTLYQARYNNEVIASSIHMHAFGETSYHHGASTHKYPKIPASYLLQWTAICDALERGDHIYNFWGIAPQGAKNHPFAGVTTFKTGFGGNLLELTHCMDIPITPGYYFTRGIEIARKWKRGF